MLAMTTRLRSFVSPVASGGPIEGTRFDAMLKVLGSLTTRRLTLGGRQGLPAPIPRS